MQGDMKIRAQFVAIRSSQLKVFEWLFKDLARTCPKTFLASAREVCTSIVGHQRALSPWLRVLSEAGVSSAVIVQCLVMACKWGAAHRFVKSLTQGSPSSCEGYEAIGCAYLKRSPLLPGLDSMNWATFPGGGPGTLWAAIIHSFRRSGNAARVQLSGESNMCRSVFDFCYSVGGCTEALKLAEFAADRFATGADRASALGKLKDEYARVGDSVKEQQCEGKELAARGPTPTP